ncbi:hypothetical protein [Paracoccus sp. (in: a-proteobacteria)]|uniref:hypothetical protein n=1 Tax=Paracoccus sp. TaxID=267 RepID=UPI0035B47462
MAVTIYGGVRRSLFEGVDRVYLGGETIALRDAEGGTLIGASFLDVAPLVIQNPAIQPVDAALGDTITLSLGLAEGEPAPVADWALTRDGTAITGLVDPATMSMELTQPGSYALSVNWSNAAGSASAEAAVLVVAAPVLDTLPAITRMPGILPETAELGDVVTLDLGAAQGLPEPVAGWDLTRDGLSIKGSVDSEALSVALTEPGVYRLSVDWTNRAGVTDAAPAMLVIEDPDEVTPPAVAPAVTRQPAIAPATAALGDSITLDLGAASGTPAPVASWDLTLDGVSVRGGVEPQALSMDLTQPGAYVLSVGWTNSAGNVTAQAATLTVAAPPTAPVINYDTQTLAYFDAQTSYAGSASDVTSVTARGTGGYVFGKNGAGAAIQRSAQGFVFANGQFLQSQALGAQPSTDGIFAVVDCTLTSYGASLGQILDGAGGHLKIRNTSGTLQVIGQDDSVVAVTLGSVAYGHRMILAGMLDDVLNLVGGIDTAGGDISAPHGGLTDPEPTRIMTGRFINGTIHRLAIVGRAEGQPWPVTMREVYADFQRGE